MKKLIFLLVVLVWSGVLILLSFSRETPEKKDGTVTIDLSEWEKLSHWDEKKKTFLETSATGARKWENTFFLHAFSPVDGIYYKSGDKKPFTLEKKWGTNTVTFGSGIFICNIQTGLEKYVFHLNDVTIVPKGRWVFLVDTTGEQVDVFPFDTFLDIELVGGAKKSRIAQFTLFPSLLFRHNPKNTTDLRGADILRISIIDSIRYTDLKTAEDSKMLFSGNNKSINELFLSEVQKDISARTNALAQLSVSILDTKTKKQEDDSFSDASSSLLINGSKREVLLKNALIENILLSLRNPQKKQYRDAIDSTVSEMKALNPNVYSEGLSLLKQYYHVTLFSHFANNTNLSSEVPTSPLISQTERLVTGGNAKQQGEYYAQLSNLFSFYYFHDVTQKNLNASFEKILQKIIDNKVLSSNEFLPFAFFVTQYLSSGPNIPNEDTMLIVYNLFQITNDYFTSNSADSKKIATITSTTFYNYTKIFTKMHNTFLSTFIDTTPNGLLLKKEYTDNENTTLEQGFVDAFLKVIATAKGDIENKKALLYQKGTGSLDSGTTDSYALLKTTLASFDTITYIFNNYPKYLNDFHLNESNKSARGILVDTENEMSMPILQSYLKNFNNLDLSSLKVMNNFAKDGFYDIEVTILGNTFGFKLWQQNHVIADVSYTDSSWKKHVFPNITLAMDQKKEQLDELLGGVSEPELQYRYDFKNFFEMTFLKGDSVVTASTEQKETAPNDDILSTTPEIQLFVQKELLDKDFRNIKDFLPIGFRNIHASINTDGNYVINLDNISKTFAGNSSNYTTELSSGYIFNRHSFSRLAFKVRQEGSVGQYEFNNTSIEILPARISLLSLPDNLKDLGYYIDAIRTSYTNQQSIVIDIIGKRVLLDKVPFTPVFPVP